MLTAVPSAASLRTAIWTSVVFLLFAAISGGFAAAGDPAPGAEVFSLGTAPVPSGSGGPGEEDAQITVYRPAHANGAAMVICPGGGYGGLVMGAEGKGIAEWLNRHDVTGVVLKYRLPKGRAMVPLQDAQRAIRMVRLRSKDWGIDPKRVGIIGFSAGGHLASTAATHFDQGKQSASDPIEHESSRPDFAILVYPVITMGEKGHAGSRQNLMGSSPSQETIDLFSNEKQVTAQTPPTFLAHAQDDAVVPPDNSRMFYEALEANKVPAKYLQLPTGGHGLNGYKGPMWDAWQAQSLQWLADEKIIPAENVKDSAP